MYIFYVCEVCIHGAAYTIPPYTLDDIYFIGKKNEIMEEIRFSTKTFVTMRENEGKKFVSDVNAS